MIKKISDCLYLCTPYACFDIEEQVIDGVSSFNITHYEPFAQTALLQAMLGSDITVTHTMSVGKIPEGVTISEGASIDGTVRGLLLAFKEFLTANLIDHVEEEDLDFSLFLNSDFEINSNSDLVSGILSSGLMPVTLTSIFDILTYRVPVFQAMSKLSEKVKFVTPDFFRVQIITALGMFERKELFGSYAIKSDSLQGFVISYLTSKTKEYGDVATEQVQQSSDQD